ncbi:hypothetical protein GCM10027048_22410 [Hymenobacter coalescens]
MGWMRLAKSYATAEVPAAVSLAPVRFLRIGGVQYKNAVRAGVTPQGLWLSAWAIFFLGHPPLFIPWSAFGPVRRQKFLWATTYATHIDCNGDEVGFQFGSDRLRAALPAFLAVQE